MHGNGGMAVGWEIQYTLPLFYVRFCLHSSRPHPASERVYEFNGLMILQN